MVARFSGCEIGGEHLGSTGQEMMIEVGCSSYGEERRELRLRLLLQ